MTHLDAPVAPAAERSTADGGPPRRSRLALASLVLGLASALVSAIPVLLVPSLAAGVVAVALGVVALRGIPAGVTGKGLAVAGIALGALSVVVAAVVGVVLATAAPADRPGPAPEAAARAETDGTGDDARPDAPAVAGADRPDDTGDTTGDPGDSGDSGRAGDAGPDEAPSPALVPDLETVPAATDAATGLESLLGLGTGATDDRKPAPGPTGSTPSPRPTTPPTPRPTTPPTPRPTTPSTPAEEASDPWCAVLTEAAVVRSQEEAGDGAALTAIHASTVAEDHRDGEWSADEGEEILVLSCRGTASWTDGTRSPVLTRLVIDTTGSLAVGFERE